MLRQCPKCSKKFRKKSAFVRHYRKKHDTRTTAWEVPKARSRKGK